MQLHQIKVDYNAEHDRLLLWVSTSDGKEMLFWLTRRCVRMLWKALIEAVKTDPRIAAQPNPEVREALVGIQHEQALKKADFSRPYQESARDRPLGAEPLLVGRFSTRRDEGGNYVLSLFPLSGQGINITLGENLLHSVCKLLQNAAQKADWDIQLAIPAPFVPEGDGASRSVN